MKSFLITDHGPALHRAACAAGAVAALLITLAWLAGEAAYDLGRQLRLALDARNDQLAAAWVALLGLVPADPTPTLIPVVAIATAPALAPAPVRKPVAPAAPRTRAAGKGRAQKGVTCG